MAKCCVFLLILSLMISRVKGLDQQEQPATELKIRESITAEQTNINQEGQKLAENSGDQSGSENKFEEILEEQKLLIKQAASLYNTGGLDAYSAVCKKSSDGVVAQGFHSHLNQETKSRHIETLCSNLLIAGLKHPEGLEWQADKWQWTKRRLDIPEGQVHKSAPKSWTGGCKDFEILTGINSVVWEGVRRYEFVCIEFLTVRLDQGTCRLLSPTKLGANFSVVADPGTANGPFVFRGVRTTYESLTKDREFEFEICQAFTQPKWPIPPPGECRFRRVTVNEEEINKIRSKVYGKLRSSDEQQCAQLCAAHPFCTSFVWGPGLSLPTMLNCELSYQKYDSNFCQSATIFETGFSHRRNYFSRDDQMIGVPCLECPS